MRAWILLSGALICNAIAPNQELSMATAIWLLIFFIGGIIMDLIDFFRVK